MREGDVFMTNDPWKGTGHLNDFTMVTPIFRKKRVVALFASTVHVTDIGGMGYGPDALQVYHEGLFMPIVKWIDAGRINDAVLRTVRANVREPVQVEGDLYALAACNEIGGRRLAAMMDEYKLADIEALGELVIARSRAAMLDAVREWPQGSWSYSMTIDGYDEPITLAATLTISKGGVDVDFTGTSGVVARGINVPKAYTDAYTSFGVRCIIGPNVPNNAGSLGVVRVSAPEGCILNAPFPLPVTARSTVGQMLPDVVFGCLRQVRPERVPAEGSSCLWLIRLSGGESMPGEPFNVMGFNTGGTGARPSKDGLSVTSFPSGVRNVAVEIMEAISPLVFWRKEYREESGGAGEHRGGHGQVIEIANGDNAPMVLAATFDHIKFPPRGSGGGRAGAGGRARLRSGTELKGMGRQMIPAGDRVIFETPGGGGIGDPKKRPRGAVKEEVENGLLSIDEARAVYGDE
jgi:N-methylhydantoinase B